MMSMTRRFGLAMAVLGLVAATVGQARAALSLTIDSYTTDALTITISGTFDQDTIGDSPGYLAIKNNWSANQGVHTELFSTTPAVTLNTIQIGGLTPQTFVQDNIDTWKDNVFFANPLGPETPILAGTTVTGSLTLSAIGAFNPADASTLELVSGFNRPPDHDDWARLEARATSAAVVPEPASLATAGLGVLMGLGYAWRRRRQARAAA